MNDLTQAMQTRCPLCLAETYILNVIPFSNGESPCHACGGRSEPMTLAAWRKALRRRRDARQECGGREPTAAE